ncbi:MAG: glycosyltransferase family 39 protein [Planctomycetota bacterium]
MNPEPLHSRSCSGLVPLWLGSFLLLLCVAYGNLESIDTAFTMQGARALVRRGDSGLLRAENGGDSLAEVAAADYIQSNSGVAFGKTGLDGVHQYVWFPIGHLWLMVPIVALGERIAAASPGVEQAFATRAGDLYYEGQFVVQQGLVALLLPSSFGATTIVLLFLIARALGSRDRSALQIALSIALATQCFPLLRETLSDGPGLTFLLAALYGVVRATAANQANVATWTMVVAGTCAGAAVLTRYQHAFLVVALGIALFAAAVRTRSYRSLLAFAAGGIPMAVLLFAANVARFGDPLTTGYPPPLSWFDTPPWQGLPKILVAAGKGILWFSPLLWLALRAPFARDRVLQLRVLAVSLLAIPVLMFSCTNGWQSGQCWGVRYVTGGVVAFLVLVLPQIEPLQRFPRAFPLLVTAGLLVNVTSLLAPTRGHNQLAGQAVLAYYEQAHQRGEITDVDLASVRLDQADRFFTLPRWSPLHANWTYALQIARGEFETADGAPRHGAERTIEPLFGVRSNDALQGRAPIHFEDRSFRWFAFVFWGELLAVPWWLLLLPPLVSGGLLMRRARRRLSDF